MRHIYLLIFCSSLLFCSLESYSQKTISPYHTYIQFGQYKGKQKLITGDTKLKYVSKVNSLEGHYFLPGMYYIGHGNYFLNGDQEYEADGDNYKGANSSFLEFALGGFNAEGNQGIGAGILCDFAFHGLHVWEQNREQKENVFQWGLGAHVPYVYTFGKMFRSVTMADVKVLVTDHEAKYFDGWGYRIQNEFQFVPFNWLLVGVRPSYEWRKYSKLQFEDKVKTKTFYMQIFVGISFKGRARDV